MTPLVTTLPRAEHVALVALGCVQAPALWTIETAAYRALVRKGLAHEMGVRPCGDMTAVREHGFTISDLGRAVARGDISADAPAALRLVQEGQWPDVAADMLGHLAAELLVEVGEYEGELDYLVTEAGALLAQEAALWPAATGPGARTCAPTAWRAMKRVRSGRGSRRSAPRRWRAAPTLRCGRRSGRWVACTPPG